MASPDDIVENILLKFRYLKDPPFSGEFSVGINDKLEVLKDFFPF